MASYTIAFALVTPENGGTHHPDTQVVEADSHGLAAAKLLTELEDETDSGETWAAYVISTTGKRVWALGGAITDDDKE